MKYNFEVELKTHDGKEMREKVLCAKCKAQEVENKIMTLSSVCINALFGMLPGDEKEAGQRKADRYDIAMKIFREKETDLTAEQISRIKERVGIMYGALIVGQVYLLLEKKDEEPIPPETEDIGESEISDKDLEEIG